MAGPLGRLFFCLYSRLTRENRQPTPSPTTHLACSTTRTSVQLTRASYEFAHQPEEEPQIDCSSVPQSHRRRLADSDVANANSSSPDALANPESSSNTKADTIPPRPTAFTTLEAPPNSPSNYQSAFLFRWV